MVPKWLRGLSLHIFRPKISLGYKNLRGKFGNNAFLANFPIDSLTLTLLLPHILRTIGFYTFPPIFSLLRLDQQKFGWFWFILSRVMFEKQLGVISTPLPLHIGRVKNMLCIPVVLLSFEALLSLICSFLLVVYNLPLIFKY